MGEGEQGQDTLQIFKEVHMRIGSDGRRVSKYGLPHWSHEPGMIGYKNVWLHTLLLSQMGLLRLEGLVLI